ncbi:MAG: T9SS type A sorting domain-containing protein [Saprospiraceae bacterium]|nr:T9SS type A sorting domain-containing protein [Saprospiraceae bacterium]
MQQLQSYRLDITKVIFVFLAIWFTHINLFSQCPNMDCNIEIESGECPTPAGHPCEDSPNCTAEDVKILDVYLATDELGTCLTTSDCESLADGDEIDVYVCIVFCSNNSSDRQGIYLGGTVMGTNSGTSLDIDHCFDLLLEQNVPKIACVPAPDTYSWDCSEALVLQNAITVWGTGSGAVCPMGGGDGTDVICGSTNKAKCRCYGDIQVTTPLRADFTWDQCVDFGDPSGLVQFSGQAMGGEGPYTYDWDFGDLNTMSNTNPATHQYNTSGPFTVTLTVTDNLSTSTVVTNEIALEACCEFSAACPMDLDLGDFDCKTLANIPAHPTDAASAAAAPYNISVGTNPCGNIIVFSVDDKEVDICASNDQTIIRTVTIFDDFGDGMGGAADGKLNLGEGFMNCVFTYDILVDDEAPVITASGSVADGADLGCNPSAADIEAALGTATASDNCSVGDPTSTDDAVTGDACTKSQTRRFNVMDACDNPATAVTRTVTWSTDTQDPTFANCANGAITDPIDLGTTAPDENAAIVAVGVPFDLCGLGNNEASAVGGPVTGGCIKSQTWTVMIDDQCGNTGSCQVTFMWTGPPLVCLAPDITDADCNAQSTGSATVNVSGGTPGYSYEWSNGQTTQTASNLTAGNYLVTVTDAEGCTILCDATISEASALTADILAFCVEEEALINLLGGASGGTGPYTFAWQGPEGFTATGPSLNDVAQGTYTLMVTDANGCTFTTAVTKDDCCDQGTLFLAAPAAQSGCHNGPSPPTAADVPPPLALSQLMNDLQVTGNCVTMQDLAVTDAISGPIVDGDLYTFTRTYYISAPNALPTQANEMIMILYDPLPPVLSGLPEDLTLTCGSEIPPAANVTGYDNISFEVPVQVSENNAGLTCTGFKVERTYTASDGCGNTVTGTQVITFVDDAAPTLVVPADTTIYCPGEIPPASYISASDNCSAFELSFDEKITELDNCDYTLTRTWTAKDACGNETTATQTITFYDQTGPTIVVTNPMLADIALGDEMVTYGCDDPRVVMEDVEIYDDCCGIAEANAEDELIASHTCDVFGYFRKWKCRWWATDEAGNYSEFYFYVLQYDTAAPVIYNVEPYIEVPCDSLVPAPDTTVYAEDDCALTSNLMFSEDTVFDASNPASYALIRTWSASDFCSNYTKAVQIVAVCDFDTILISSSIGNQVWEDANGNGLQDSLESGINDVTVYLYNQDILLQDGWFLVDSTKTSNIEGQTGQFRFDYLHPGEYQVQFKKMEMLSFTIANQGTDEFLDSDADPETGMTDPIYILAYEDADYIDAGMMVGTLVPSNPDNEKIKSKPCATADCIADEMQLLVFPNPFGSEISLQYTSEENTRVQMEVFDALGRSIKTIQSSAVKGINQERINLKTLDVGVYFIRIQAGGRSAHKMIVKAK